MDVTDTLLPEVRRLRALRQGNRKIGRQLGISKDAAMRLINKIKLEEASVPTTAPIESIAIGKRVRLEYGSVERLARSINENGLLHPVVVRAAVPASCAAANRGELHYELIAGERRLKAWQLSRFRGDPVPIRIVDLASVMRGEWAENHERKNFTPSETVAIKRALEIEFDLKGEADKRKRRGKKVREAEAGRATEKVADYVGKSWRTIEKAEAVVAAAERDPERFGRLRDDMDRTEKVDGPFKRLANMEAASRIKSEPPPLPGQGPYRTIVIDPPWPADLDGYRDHPEDRGYYPYATMSLEAIASINMASLAHPEGCALWLWITNFHLVRGCQLPLLKAWGFDASTLLSWCKPHIGQGQRLRGASEQCVLAVRGSVPVLGSSVKTWFEAKSGGDHSAKPSEFYRIVEDVTPAPRYASLFSGKDRREGWDMHGDRAMMAAA